MTTEGIAITDVIEQSEKQDLGKFDFEFPRGHLSFGFEQEKNGDPAFFLQAKDEPDLIPRVRGNKLFFTSYAYLQWWKQVARFPTSGVVGKKLSPELITAIATYRVGQAGRAAAIRCRLKEADSKLTYRGFLPSGRPIISTTSLLHALRIAGKGTEVRTDKTPEWKIDHIFQTNILVGDQRTAGDKKFIPSVLITNSEVAACDCSLEAAVYFPASGSIMLLPGRHCGFTVTEQHTDIQNLVSSVEETFKGLDKQVEDVPQLVQIASNKTLGTPREASDSVGKRYRLPQGITSRINSELLQKAGAETAQVSVFDTAVAIATVGRNESPSTRVDMYKFAGKALTH